MPEILQIMLDVIAPIFLVVGLAVIYTRRFNPQPRTFSSVVLYLFSPFLVFEGIANAQIATGELLKFTLVVVGVAGSMAVIGLLTARLLRLNRRQESAFVLCLIMVNAANYGIPLNEFAFGQQAVQHALIYYVVSVMIGNTLGVFFASRGSVSSSESARNIFRVPLIYAALAGLLVNAAEIDLPLALARAVGLLADAAVPAMLVVLGMQLAHVSIQGRMGLILLASTGRLVVASFIAIGLVGLLGLSGLSQKVAIVESSMPTAVMASILATEFDADSGFVTSVIVVSTLISILTLSILLSFLT